MTLEDLDWSYASIFNEIDRHAVFGTRTCMWRIIQFKDGTYTIQTRHKEIRSKSLGWINLDVVAATCVLMHLTGGSDEAR